MTRRRPGLLVSVCAATLLVGACSSGDDIAEPTISTTPPQTASEAPISQAPISQTSISQTPTLPPPYIEGADWVDTEVGPSLQVRPTRNGRDVSGGTAGDEAWGEVLALHLDADSPGMRAQFDCHWTFARLVDPEKTSWNLEPRRPVVSESEMISTRCNPGFPEEK
ncbi:DUF2599 domain-containing protein [Gordonia liuliyuniae]|uniref:DUF2599 domain-containing protein n=1 Tax=Gordonia liuliyuniae TaxID=2911517 RepID=A0ABS9IVP8_9ACTN|nr:DUF2599 domain-containing protein [Gordonia liuliyuniae]MCF8589628.1 DUF2599 domain-containing protein [Gordonia liuliyuniae]